MNKPFKKPIYVTRPIMPDIDKYTKLLKAVVKTKVLSNNAKYLIDLENRLKVILDVENNAAFCNGTIALMIALKSLNLKGSIITTPFTFPATANAIVWNNLTPIFCDIDYDTMNITPEAVEKHIVRDTSAILAVHVFGTPCDVHGFEILAFQNKLKLVYDAAHAFMTTYDNMGISNFGDITMFSFHPTKLFHTSEGGMLTYNDPDLDVVVKQLRNFGIKDDNTGSICPGINGKMNELQAIMGLCILDKIKDEKRKRKKISTIYKTYLSDISWINIPDIDKNVGQSYQYFPIRIQGKSRNEIDKKLKKYNIFARKYFYPLCSDFKHFQYLKSNLPVAKKVSEEILCLPYYGELTEDDVNKICSILVEE